ncbi:unnamed protein product [Didymodactylos carnosus]|uniref:Uncharacterized protein n=1 Tax=Didymodactylos carnosus TaxID=1234261 RepID=A0A8S2NF66_9BILA|nr:unnamed protein product [Didymodactylos carnosus]CAF3998031.1 unnamed protein product [Didymodactylos carnosus]
MMRTEFIEGVSSLIKKAIAPLQQRVKLLEDRLEKLESNGNVEQLVIDTCSSIGVSITSGDISVCHNLIRSGSNNNQKQLRNQALREIIVRFIHYKSKSNIMMNKKRLDKAISINEDLIPHNYKLFKYAKSKSDKKKVRTLNGIVIYHDGKKNVNLFTQNDVNYLLDEEDD